ncbi:MULTISPECIES: amidohydrolase [unclassified Arthrobacter]|uniref:amidohydrolase n=1 Tax=unclassified Arthrobacter TaxID=235627 RepID=UPI001C84A0AE|nr:amidohydrolase [Arthrobacter sp. MAHUQ-56]MBX7443840.1 amidohydrolase [Arthrobacter sp. MAHUQ-56]
MNPDLIILAGTVHTMDAGSGSHPAPEAVAVRNGRIHAIGTRKEAASWGRAEEVLEFGDAVLTPGLVDCHVHPVMGLDMTRGCNLSGITDLAAIRALLRAEADATPAGDWVRAWGLDPNAFGSVPPHRELIDDVVAGRPALIRLFDAHSALASSRALDIAGISGPHAFDQAAEVVCDGNGRPTGLLLEAAALDLVLAHMPAESFEDRKLRLGEVLTGFSRAGLTGIHVMDCGEGTLDLLASLENDNAGEGLPLRVRISPWCMPGSDEASWELLAGQVGTMRGQRWEIAGIKLFVDGTVDNGTAWLFEPDSHGQSTTPFWPRPEEYARAIRFFAGRGIPTATHAIGDAGVAAVLGAFEALPVDVPPAPHRIEHIETVPDQLINRFARSGLIASMQPSHCTHYSRADQTDNWSTRLGKERADRGWRCADLRSAGATLALGSDWPVAPFEPLPILADAQLRRRSGHPDEQPIVPRQALTALQALEGYTSHAAKAAGEWAVSGSVTVGKRADFTIFDVDPLSAAPDDLASARVLATIVDGQPHHLSVGADR